IFHPGLLWVLGDLWATLPLRLPRRNFRSQPIPGFFQPESLFLSIAYGELKKNKQNVSPTPARYLQGRRNTQMSSAAQIKANQQNAQFSTGPVSEAGRQ